MAKLEEKLDGLVTLLQSSHEPTPIKEFTTSSLNIGRPEMAGISLPVSQTAKTPATVQYQIGWSQAHDQQHPRIPPTQIPPNFQTTLKTYDLPTTQPSNALQPNFEDPDVLLSLFRVQMSPYFPFVVVPQNISAADLRRDRPFLLNAILAVSSRSSSKQKNLGNEVLRQLAEKVFVNGERNLDVLLGILTYAGWCVTNFFLEDGNSPCF